ncbi:hypothetical protein [Polaribacter sp. SA4-12]|uniref:hypothetical protein n=1 Tax=Polaribacter sp. SA4-12 TaxID=1312072 RepID=UPI000B3C7074|nr:hypothetical protein [Polaribacter sp. SA4-12]ARV14303.1 hypothetical protein BTO07_03660 [Polaribacter sp. SA4-12]
MVFIVGNSIQKNNIICELESDIITIKYENFVSGKLVEITNKNEILLHIPLDFSHSVSVEKEEVMYYV